MIHILELFKIAGRVDLEGADKAEKDLDQLDNKGKSTSGRLKNAGKKVAKAGAVVGGAFVAAGTAAVGLAGKAGNAADRILDIEAATGLSTDAIQEWDYIAGQAGVSQDTIADAAGRIARQMSAIEQGTGKASEAVSELGLSYEDLEKMSPDEQFDTIIQQLGDIEDEGKRASVGSDLFGRQWEKIAPVVSMGGDELEKLKDEAHDLGGVMDKDALDGANEFRMGMEKLQTAFGGAMNQIGAKLAPLLTDTLIPAFEAVLPHIINFVDFIASGFTTVFEKITEWKVLFEEWFESNSELFTNIRDMIIERLQMVWEFIQEIWTMITEFWKENGQEILDNAMTIFQSVWETVKTAFESIQEVVQQVLDLIVPFIQEQLAKIQKFWDENGEQIMAAVQNAFSIIQGVIKAVMNTVSWIIDNVWGNIKGIFDSAVNVVLGIVDFLASMLTGDFSGMKDALIDIWNNLWNIIEEVVSGAWNLLSGAFGKLWDSISGWFTDLGSDAKSWGSDVVTGLWEGIKGMGDWISKKVSGFVSDVIPGPVKKVLGIASPSKLMMEYGEDTGEGLALGIEDKQSRLQKTAQNVARTVEQGINSNINVGSSRQLPQTNNTTTNDNRQDITIHNTFTTKEMSPSEIARKERQQLQRLGVGFA